MNACCSFFAWSGADAVAGTPADRSQNKAILNLRISLFQRTLDDLKILRLPHQGKAECDKTHTTTHHVEHLLPLDDPERIDILP